MTSTRRGEDESERTFPWFEPSKRRATLYEDITVDTQPATARHLVRGWPLWFEDGRSTWDTRSTELRSIDWYAFRDPAQMWERPFYQLGTTLEREIENAVRESRLTACSRTTTPHGWRSYASSCRSRRSSSMGSGTRPRASRAIACRTR